MAIIEHERGPWHKLSLIDDGRRKFVNNVQCEFPGATEQLHQADGTPVTSTDTGFQDDTICCIASSDSHLLIGRDSGSILLFSLVNFKKITSINMNSRPYKLGLNSNSRYGYYLYYWGK